MPDSEAPELLPRSFGDLFDEAFDLYKRNFTLLASAAAMIHVPANIVWAGLTLWLGLDRPARSGASSTEAEFAGVLGVLAVFILNMGVQLLITVLESGAVTIAAS